MPIVLAAITALLWGLWSYVELRGMRESSPVGFNVTMSAVTIFLNALFVLPLCLWLSKRLSHRVVWNWKVILLGVVVIGVCELAAFSYLFALRDGKAAKVILIASTYPLVSVFLCWFFEGEKLSLKEWLGALCIVIGLALVGKE